MLLALLVTSAMSAWLRLKHGSDPAHVLYDGELPIHGATRAWLGSWWQWKTVAQDLKYLLLASWCQIPHDTFRGLVESMTQWVRAVLETRGTPTQNYTGGANVMRGWCMMALGWNIFGTFWNLLKVIIKLLQ